jgi:hypothetical protein
MIEKGQNIYQNFINLFSSDIETRYQALNEKKTWILDKFYIPYSFAPKKETNEPNDLECLFHSALPFNKLISDKVSTLDRNNNIETFNKNFYSVKLYKNLPPMENTNYIYAEVNFKSLAKNDYKKLMPSFFPCLNNEEIDQTFPNGDLRNVIQIAFEGHECEYVLILDKKAYPNYSFIEVEGFTKIYTPNTLPEKIDILTNKIADKLNVRSVTIHVK